MIGVIPRILLASTSPTRKALCEKLGLKLEFVSPYGAREEINAGPSVEKLVVENALSKAKATAAKTSEGIVIGLDTVVHFGGKAIGKPKDPDDAKKILSRFSGKQHEIVTGIAAVEAASGKTVTGVEKTRVKFRHLSEKQVDDYVATGEPFGKAGAYAIQEKGRELVERVEGSEANVAGLPVEKITEVLKEFGVAGLPRK